ncbi:hypothetical protein K402DRAFT_229120 [Aulographum hederae CBS 113979]|uniref:DUF7613 domain-containing protein n=1 Tax=Aulographum hederae CBS 113979 TaxID=1176131 RepID=A0A6G1HB96_9PEZI|nr:hypothetical protein K402DRAFT_229120 [Aulographum hederae CBS 113979]
MSESRLPWRRSKSQKQPPEPPSGEVSSDVMAFLAPSIEKAARLKQPAAPRIDVSAAQRFPESIQVEDPANRNDNPNGFLRPTRNNRTVSFSDDEPDIIGEGGEEAELPPSEIRHSVPSARSSRAASNTQDDDPNFKPKLFTRTSTGLVPRQSDALPAPPPVPPPSSALPTPLARSPMRASPEPPHKALPRRPSPRRPSPPRQPRPSSPQNPDALVMNIPEVRRSREHTSPQPTIPPEHRRKPPPSSRYAPQQPPPQVPSHRRAPTPEGAEFTSPARPIRRTPTGFDNSNAKVHDDDLNDRMQQLDTRARPQDPFQDSPPTQSAPRDYYGSPAQQAPVKAQSFQRDTSPRNPASLTNTPTQYRSGQPLVPESHSGGHVQRQDLSPYPNNHESHPSTEPRSVRPNLEDRSPLQSYENHRTRVTPGSLRTTPSEYKQQSDPFDNLRPAPQLSQQASPRPSPKPSPRPSRHVPPPLTSPLPRQAPPAPPSPLPRQVPPAPPSPLPRQAPPAPPSPLPRQAPPALPSPLPQQAPPPLNTDLTSYFNSPSTPHHRRPISPIMAPSVRKGEVEVLELDSYSHEFSSPATSHASSELWSFLDGAWKSVAIKTDPGRPNSVESFGTVEGMQEQVEVYTYFQGGYVLDYLETSGGELKLRLNVDGQPELKVLCEVQPDIGFQFDQNSQITGLTPQRIDAIQHLVQVSNPIKVYKFKRTHGKSTCSDVNAQLNV